MQANPHPSPIPCPASTAASSAPREARDVVLTTSLGHVLALRLYTTNAYRSLNDPLRNKEREEAHPFPVSTPRLELVHGSALHNARAMIR